jgi:hypothetical protein
MTVLTFDTEAHQPQDSTLTFGKYENMLYSEVLRSNPHYCYYIADKESAKSRLGRCSKAKGSYHDFCRWLEYQFNGGGDD